MAQLVTSTHASGPATLRQSAEAVDGHGPWLIGFVENPLPRWCRIFTRPGFRHVFAVRHEAQHDVWVFAEWCTARLKVKVVAAHVVAGMLARAQREGAVLAFAPESNAAPLFPRSPIYCVTWVKHLLGLKHCLAMTPHQLFRALQGRGAVAMTEPGVSAGPHMPSDPGNS